MTPNEAADLAARTLAKIDYIEKQITDAGLPLDAILYRHTADRERVESDLAGLRDHQPATQEATYCACMCDYPCPDAARYADGLRRTAALYGVTS